MIFGPAKGLESKGETFKHLLSSRVYEAFEEGRRTFGTSDLVIIVDMDVPANDPQQRNQVFERKDLAADQIFPEEIRTRISIPARIPNLVGEAFWVLVLCNSSVATIAVGVRVLNPGGSA